MSLRIITGSTGTNHVTSQDDGSLNQVILGSKSVVLDIGEKLSATIVDNNTVRISDGDLLLQGRHARVDAGTVEDVTIGTGTIEMNRNDFIVARYTLDTATGYEDISFVVIEGTETSGTASDPAYNTGDIRTGSAIVDFPLYRVKIEGINIVGLVRLFEITGGASSSLIGEAYSASKNYSFGEVCIDNGVMWTSKISNNIGNAPQEGTYWTKSSIAKQLGGLQFGIDGDGNGGYYKADGSFAPFSGVDDLLPFFNDCIFLSSTVGDQISYYSNGRKSTRTSNEPALIGFYTTNTGYKSPAILAKSAGGRSISEKSTDYGAWTSSVGTITTPKGHTVYWGAGGGASQETTFNVKINGKTVSAGEKVEKCPIRYGSQINTLALWLADKLLFGE